MSDLLLRMRAIFCIFWYTKINLGLKGIIHGICNYTFGYVQGYVFLLIEDSKISSC